MEIHHLVRESMAKSYEDKKQNIRKIGYTPYKIYEWGFYLMEKTKWLQYIELEDSPANHILEYQKKQKPFALSLLY